MKRPLLLVLTLAAPSLALANGRGGAPSSHASAASHPAPAAPSAGTSSGPPEHRTGPTGGPKGGTPGTPGIPWHPYPGTTFGGGVGYMMLGNTYCCGGGYYHERTYVTADPSPSLPRLALELGVSSRHLVAGAPSSDSSVATQLRLLGGFRHGVYAGVEGEAGMMANASTEMANPAREYGFAGVLGVMQHSGDFAVGIEAAVGGRTYEQAPNSFTLDHGTSTVAIVEARVRAEYELSSNVALGAAVGSSVIDRGDWTAGAYVSMHTQAFGGAR